MKISVYMLKTCVVLVALVAFGTFAQGQNRERFGISAKAGGVNAVTGRVLVKSSDQKSRLLNSQDDLASGDIVTTSLGSQVEVLLNPGTYLRLAETAVGQGTYAAAGQGCGGEVLVGPRCRQEHIRLVEEPDMLTRTPRRRFADTASSAGPESTELRLAPCR